MLLFFTTLALAAEDLAPQIRYWSNRANAQVIVASQETDIFTELQQTLKENPTLPAIPEVIPKIGDFDAELERLKERHNLECVLFLKYDEKKQIVFQDIGNCEASTELAFRIDEFQGKWDVYDQSNNIVPVESFARVCNDYTLQARLEQEDRYLKRNTKILRWSAGTLALASFIPLQNDSLGLSTREEARLWSFVFLMGSASVLYFSRNIPLEKVTEERSTIRNYHTRGEVERILAQHFPPPQEEASSETDTPSTEGSDQNTPDAILDDATENTDERVEDPKNPTDDLQIEESLLPENSTSEPAPPVEEATENTQTETSPPEDSDEREDDLQEQKDELQEQKDELQEQKDELQEQKDDLQEQKDEQQEENSSPKTEDKK